MPLALLAILAAAEAGAPAAAAADTATDAGGHTRWERPLRPGGAVDPGAGTHLPVMVDGDSFPRPDGAAPGITSADLDGSGVVNLSDAGRMSRALGRECP